MSRNPLCGPTGLGTSAARLSTAHRHRGTEPADDPVPGLHCPPAVRDDPALGEIVNERLVSWAGQVGIYTGRLDSLRTAAFGRMAMLVHPDVDDPDRLLASAKCLLAEWATDDYYCDDESAGAKPELLGPRLALASAAIDPVHLPAGYAPGLERRMRDDPVLAALRSAAGHLARYASTAQLARLSHEISMLFHGYSAEAGWRMEGRTPPVWEYLAIRQLNSFLPCLTVIDAVGGYELGPREYADPRVRRSARLAAAASTLVNDLYSQAKEDGDAGVGYNLPGVIAAEENCSAREAVKRSVDVHNELARAFEAEAAVLSRSGSPELRRFLTGLWSWMGGNREWHRGSARYRAP